MSSAWGEARTAERTGEAVRTAECTSSRLALAGVEGAFDDRTRDLLQRRLSGSVRRRGWLVRRALAAADVIGLASAFVLALWLFGGDEGAPVPDRIDPQIEALLFFATLPVWVVMAKLYGLYDHDEERTGHSTVDEIGGVFHMVTVVTWLVFGAAWLVSFAEPQLDKLLAFWSLAVLLMCLLRVGARASCRRHASYRQNVIIVGAGDVGQTIARKLVNHPEYGISLLGFVDNEPKERRDGLGDLTLLGGTERLRALVELLDVDRVIFAFSNESEADTVELVRTLQTMDVQIDVVPRLYELVAPGGEFHAVEGLPLLRMPPLRLSRSSAFLKRTLDLMLTIPGLIVLSPVLVAIAIAIKLHNPGPVFFRQVRMGAKGPFRIWKFRTMWVDADERKHEFTHLNKHLAPGGDARMFKIDDDPRVTKAGGFLRRHSLDELPQLFNVATGDMTLVGPRPLILEEDCYVHEWARQRLSLKPGVTGLWQAFGRSGIPFEEMLKLDYLYVTNWSPLADLRIILQTVPVLVRAQSD
ncbi:MAG: sugar transferase [Gaiellaceae bacterium MAG52_C11]|nr:sugar transferase [Candidatus Gaiellasilicea maunaloa]